MAPRGAQLFVRAQADSSVPTDTDDDEYDGTAVDALCADFEQWLTFLWLCLKERFGGARSEAFGPRVKDWLDFLPQLAPEPTAAAAEPEPVTKGKSKKKP